MHNNYQKIGVIDDHPLFRTGLIGVLRTLFPESEFYEFGSAEECLEQYRQIKFDLVFVDIDLPGINGLDLCERMRGFSKSLKILLLSVYKDEVVVNKGLKNGADGYLVKENTVEELTTCLKLISDNKSFVSALVKSNKPGDMSTDLFALKTHLHEVLTNTEFNVLKLVSNKCSSKEIADQLFVTVKSVETYRSRICKKLNLDSKNNSLLVWAIEHKALLNNTDLRVNNW
jgi:DNA-binding NarL/FixJ family response regulator